MEFNNLCIFVVGRILNQSNEEKLLVLIRILSIFMHCILKPWNRIKFYRFLCDLSVDLFMNTLSTKICESKEKTLKERTHTAFVLSRSRAHEPTIGVSDNVSTTTAGRLFTRQGPGHLGVLKGTRGGGVEG